MTLDFLIYLIHQSSYAPYHESGCRIIFLEPKPIQGSSLSCCCFYDGDEQLCIGFLLEGIWPIIVPVNSMSSHIVIASIF